MRLLMPDPTQPRIALDFELTDTHGRTVRLSDYRSRENVVLVFNRGFA
jgi:peroxiredoxin